MAFGGERQPLLLLHSVPSDMETLAPVTDALADMCRAITISKRRSSDWPRTQVTEACSMRSSASAALKSVSTQLPLPLTNTLSVLMSR